MSRKQVLVYRALPAEQLDRIRQEHDVVVADPRIADQEVAFLEALPQAQGLIGSSYSIDEALLARATRLAVEIGRAHVCTPVTNAQLVCRLSPAIKKNKK